MTRGLRSKSMTWQVWDRDRFTTRATVTLPYSAFAFCWHCLVWQMLLHHLVESHLCATIPSYKWRLHLSMQDGHWEWRCFSVPVIYQFESHETEFISCQWFIFHLLLLRIVTKYNSTSEAAWGQSSSCKLCTLQNNSIIW